MGNTADLYQEGLRRIENVLPIWGYCDSNEVMRRKKYANKVVISPEELIKMKDICVLICVGNIDAYNSIRHRLDVWKIENYCINEVIFSLFNKEVKNCSTLFDDELSREIFIDAIDSFCSMHWPSYDDNSEVYFLQPYMKQRTDNEIFIDCGAFCGDTIDSYLKDRNYTFGRIIAFEPDCINYDKCKNLIEKLENDGLIEKGKILLYSNAVGEKESIVKIAHYVTEDSNGLGSKISNDGDYEVRVIPIDKLIKNKVDFIKSDIEGYDYNMLLGAENTIRNNKPLLSICVYHNSLDLFQIPLMIKRIVPEYKFILRHYGNNLSEYILYAYI